MSGTSFGTDCPKCGGKDTVMASSDYKPHDCVCGECLECGFSYWTVSGQMDLEELNEIRADHELEPLAALPKIDLNSHEKSQMALPDLLKACEMSLGGIKELVDIFSPEGEEVLKTLEEAIKKAKGL